MVRRGSEICGKYGFLENGWLRTKNIFFDDFFDFSRFCDAGSFDFLGDENDGKLYKNI